MEKETKIFRGSGLNRDDDLDLLQGGDSRYRHNIGFINGNYDDLIPRFSPAITSISSLPNPGSNVIIGSVEYKEVSSVILFVYNRYDNHSIVLMDFDGSTSFVSYAQSFWNFSLDKPIYNAVIVGDGEDATLVWTDQRNPIRAINLTDFIADPSTEPSEANACLHKPSPLNIPTAVIGSDTGYKANNITGHIFQFAYRYVYDNKQKSTLSPWSEPLYDYDNEYTHALLAKLDVGNYIQLTLPVDYPNIDRVEILVRQVDVGSGAPGYWILYDSIEASEPSVTYDFYNNNQGYVFGEDDARRLFDDVPDLAKAVELINENRLVVGGYTKGLVNPTPNITLIAAYDDLSTTAPESVIDTDTAADSSNADVDLTTAYTGSESIVIKIVFQTSGDVETYTINYSGDFDDADDCVDHFVTIINDQNTHFSDPTPASNTGGDVLVVANDSGETIEITVYRFAVYDKAKSLHAPAKHFFGMRYYDEFGKCGAVVTGEDFVLSLDNVGTFYPSLTGDYVDERIWKAYYIITHTPPSWATHYQWMYGGSNIIKRFTLPIKIHNEDCDVEMQGDRVQIDMGQALERFLETQGIDDYNDYFFPAKGDQVIFRALFSDNLTSDTLTSYARDSIVIDVDSTNDYVYIANSNELLRSITGNADETYITMEFCSLSPESDPESRVFYEVGDLIPITGGYHTATGDTDFTIYGGASVAVVNQSLGVTAKGTIEFGNDFVLREMLYYDPSDLLSGFIHSMSSSLFYESHYSGVGRYGLVDEEAYLKFYNAVQWSGVWRDDSLSFSEFNKFESDNVEYLNDKHGEIVALREMGYSLYVFQRSKVTPIEVGRQTVEQDGQYMVVSTDVVLGSARPFEENYGTIFPGSIAQRDRSLFFYDHQKATVYRLAQNGMNDIGIIKMKTFFVDLTNTISSDITNYNFLSFYDYITGCYVLTFKDSDTPANNWSLSFDTQINRWQCTENYGYEAMVCLNGAKVYSFQSENKYAHHNDTLCDYDDSAYVDVHFNNPPLERKEWRFIEIDSDYQYTAVDSPSIWVDTDKADYESDDTHIHTGGEQQSLIPTGKFDRINGKYIASFLRSMLYKDGTDAGVSRLYNGDVLSGKHITVRLTNAETEYANKLRAVSVGFKRRR